MALPPPVSLLFSLCQLGHHPASGPLHILCPLPGLCSPQLLAQFIPSPHSGLCSLSPHQSPSPTTCFIFINFIFWSYPATCRISVSQPGIEPRPPALETHRLNHGTTREVPPTTCFIFYFIIVIFKFIILTMYCCAGSSLLCAGFRQFWGAEAALQLQWLLLLRGLGSGHAGFCSSGSWAQTCSCQAVWFRLSSCG